MKNTKEFFTAINKILKEKNKLPDILDYEAPVRQEENIYNPEFYITAQLDYGGSEGIYLDLFIKSYGGSKIQRIGCYKTLYEDDNAMRTMGQLYADFVIESTNYINEHYNEFGENL